MSSYTVRVSGYDDDGPAHQPGSVDGMSRRAAAGAAILTGPGEEGKVYPCAGAAVSGAITRACRASEPCTFYVRDPDGLPLYYVERHDGRLNVTVHTVNTPHKETR